MADKYINEVGLLAIRNWANGKFALDTELDALDAKVDEIISEGGEPNTIESISVNGTAVAPDAQKNVALTVPTATSDLTNDSNFAVDANYVHTDNNYTTTEKTKLEGVEAGAEANVIETVKVNGTALTPDAQKAVDVTVPTKVSDLTNDGDGTTGSEFATKAYVDTNGGKIDKIKVNGTEQTIVNKEVDLTIPTKVSDITNDSNFQTDTQVSTSISTALANNGDPYQTQSDVSTAISSAVASAYKYKGSVATFNDLPASGNTTGDVWDVQATGVNYAWTGTTWDALGPYVDTSLLWSNVAGQNNSLIAMTNTEVMAILEPSA